MSELARHSPSSLFGTHVECRCQSCFDIRTISIFRTNAQCRCQSWLDIAPARYSGLVSNVDVRAGSTFAQLDIRDFCRMSVSELARHSPQLDIRDKYRMLMSELARYFPQLDIRD
ncbi:hypothetical protein DPMN_081803 [Dreissena polymorpha]|uniref:Uncharacterized protein n=1 Tax=Dreissena polymorpha TaxID=45954 RepID=A0A9D3Y5Q6_DREPO|nr:hypothetical protein DPMN_081803 [Dreissena polymorpha]